MGDWQEAKKKERKQHHRLTKHQLEMCRNFKVICPDVLYVTNLSVNSNVDLTSDDYFGKYTFGDGKVTLTCPQADQINEYFVIFPSIESAQRCLLVSFFYM